MSAIHRDEMTCAELVEVVTEYLEDRLPADDRRRFEEHLEKCPWCSNYLEQMRQTIRVLGRLSEDSIPAEMREQLLEAFRGFRRAR